MVNITNMQQLHSLIDRGMIKGCGHCNAEFDDDDFAFALETGTCQCCHEILYKGLTDCDMRKEVK